MYMPNENYGKPSEMTINIEWLSVNVNGGLFFDAGLEIDELIYDFDKAESSRPFETYFKRTEFPATLKFTKKLALHLPALRMEYRLKRGEYGNSSFMMPYEYLEPFVRNGVYMQELQARRTVWGSDEVHHISDTGLVGKSAGFMWISSIGICSIPFREYVTTGSKLVIPAAPETGRIEWTDIWGRRWAQPIRSLYVDVPPIPPPIRNFMMTTTFELIHAKTQKRIYEWTSDEDVIVRAHMKLLNNYPKWFEITNCKENRKFQIGNGRHRIFSSDDINEYKGTDMSSDHYLDPGYDAAYGKCFAQDPVYLEGQLLTEQQRTVIAGTGLCTSNETYYNDEACKELLKGDYPQVHKRGVTHTTPGVRQGVPNDVWNYAKQVEDHWPVNYIKENMWDMTHYDYDDTKFDKAYKYHMDNNLPDIDNSQIWPLNFIAFPLFKGLGYSMTYDKTLTLNRFNKYKGWWSDNLQNRDNTLVAGQQESNDISIGKPDLSETVGWVDVRDTIEYRAGGKEKTWIDNRLKNMYACAFNRKRIRVDPTSDKISYPTNVYINNVVPVDPSLDKYDDRIFNYNCDNTPMYVPTNISSFPNLLETETARDWLYFAANLRGGAKETINVLYTLKPLADSRREGITKVQDGGRFTYWNPCCGINAWLIVDDPVQTVIAKRVDLNVTEEIFPLTTLTYNAYVYQLINIKDKEEINREYKMSIYYNYFGFGDAAVSVYVGGVHGTSALLEPGDVTYVKVEFQNNAGFDWNMFGDAITFNTTGKRPINANDLLLDLVHTIREPWSYNFMTVNVPDYLKPYITVKPSKHNVDTAPLFFDFDNINVVTIRDGFKGVYYYEITVADAIPDSIRGRMHSIPITFNSKYFEALPGTGYDAGVTDPSGVSWHDYTLKIPDFLIGFRYASSSPYAGKVFHTWGRASSLHFSNRLDREHWQVIGAKTVTEEQVNALRLISSTQNSELRFRLNKFWTDELKSSDNIDVPFVQTQYDDVYDSVDYDLSVLSPFGRSEFPIEVPAASGPDIASVNILVRTYAPQLENGYNLMCANTYLDYYDTAPKYKWTHAGNWYYVRASGAHLSVSYQAALLDEPTRMPRADQSLHYDDSGVARIIVTIHNDGDDIAYNTVFTVFLASDLEVMTEELKGKYTLTDEYEPYTNQLAHKLTLFTTSTILKGEKEGRIIYVKYPPMNLDDYNSKRESGLPTERLFVCKARGAVDLSNTTQVSFEMSTHVEQDFDKSYYLPVDGEEGPKAVLSGTKTRSVSHLQVELDLDLEGLGDSDGFYYEWWRSNLNFNLRDSDPEWYIFKEKTSHASITADVAVIDGNQDREADFMVVVRNSTDGYVIGSNVYHYRNGPEWWIVVVGVAGGLIIIGAFLVWLLAHKVRRQLQSDSKDIDTEMGAVASKRMGAVTLGEGQTSVVQEAPTQNALKLGSYYRGGVSGAGSAQVNWGQKGATQSAPREVVGVVGPKGSDGDDLAPAVPDKGYHGPRAATSETWSQRMVTTLSSMCCFCIVRSKGQQVRNDEQSRTVASSSRPTPPPTRPPPPRPASPLEEKPSDTETRPTAPPRRPPPPRPNN